MQKTLLIRRSFMVILVSQIENAGVFAFVAISEDTGVEWFFETSCLGDCVVAAHFLDPSR